MKDSVLILIVYGIGFLDLFGANMVVSLLLPTIMELGASPFIAGCFGSLYGFLQFFSSPYVGNLSDSKNPKTVLIACCLTTAFSYALLGATPWLSVIFVCRVIAGMFKHSQTISKAYLALLRDKEMKSGVFANFGAVSLLGYVMGPAVGGHLSELPRGFMLICLTSSAAFCLCSVIVFIFLPEKTSNKKPTKSEDSKENTWKKLLNMPWKEYKEMLIVIFFLVLSPLIYNSNFVVTAKETLGLTGRNLGYVLSFQGAIFLVFSFLIAPISKVYRNNKTMLLHCAILQCCAIFLLTYVWNVASLVVLSIPLLLTNAALRVICTQILLDQSEKSQVGTVFGMTESMAAVSKMAAPVVAGYLQGYSRRGPGLAATVCSAIGTLLVVICWNKIGRQRVKIN